MKYFRGQAADYVRHPGRILLRGYIAETALFLVVVSFFRDVWTWFGLALLLGYSVLYLSWEAVPALLWYHSVRNSRPEFIAVGYVLRVAILLWGAQYALRSIPLTAPVAASLPYSPYVAGAAIVALVVIKMPTVLTPRILCREPTEAEKKVDAPSET